METLSGFKESWLSWFLKGLLVLGFVVFFARLIELTVIKGSYYKKLSDNNRIRAIPINAPRGEILARGGEVLVGNVPVEKSIVFQNNGVWEKRQIDVSTKEGEKFKEFERVYELGADMAHVGGYLGQVNADEVGKIDPNCPEKGPREPGALIGRMGLEEEYECRISGIAGEEVVEVDTKGRKVRTLGRREPIPGETIHTSIDFGLQKKTGEIMKDKKGVTVVSDVNGAILALYSAPSFDPKKVSNYIENTDLPLFNRAIGGIYHPGSVFKIVTSVAALQEGKIDNNYRFNDPGIIKVNNFEYSNWYFSQYGKKEGLIDLTRAIARSTDTFFYKVGELVGPELLANWAKKFGMDEKTGVDLPGEVAGLIPSPNWKLKTKGEQWFLGNTFHFAIGQGDVALSPLNVNMMTSVIASGGKLCRPRVAKSTSECKDLKINRTTIEEIKKGMIGACSSGGTAFPFFGFSPVVACKTGTAQTQKENINHAWFTAFAPPDFPEIVITVLVEEGGEGSYVAAPLARDIMDYYFHANNPK